MHTHTHMHAHTIHIYACAQTARDSFDPTRSAKQRENNGRSTDKDMVSADNTKALGFSGLYPVVGMLAVSSGRHRCTLKADGSNRMYMGLVGDDVDVRTRWYDNERCWGVQLGDRYMHFAGQFQWRSAGPDGFAVPCEVTVVVDCDAGTMSFGVEGQMELTVVCESLPKNEALRFGCATSYDSCDCEVEMVAYEQL